MTPPSAWTQAQDRPDATTAIAVEPPEAWRARLKRRLLGPPLLTEQLQDERLGKPTALAVFASDNLSSVAYGTEEILRHLIPYVGVAAFTLVKPITTAVVVVLIFLVISYSQTIKAYPSAGGAYVVTRDNFGLLTAQVAGVALLTDYLLTAAVSVAAGTAALTSAIPSIGPFAVPVSCLFLSIIAYENLRGVRESGRTFAVPTYFFITTMAALLCLGFWRIASGRLPRQPIGLPGMVGPGHPGNGMLMGAGLFVVLRAFASGGAAVTGVEAISNGVSAFRPPEWKNARMTLVIMASTLGAMFLGLSFLAAHSHVSPYERGTPTVLSQVGRLVFGHSAVGQIAYYGLQGGTILILVLAANTSYADFPRLARLQAGDNYLPRPLMNRGQRLVFSNGILSLTTAAAVLIVLTGAKVDHLIPLYAVGVFSSFTLSQAGMAKHHLTRREQGWRFGVVVNATGAVLSGLVGAVIAVTKWKPAGTVLGAWVVIVFIPVMVIVLLWLHRQYEFEAAALRLGAPDAALAPLPERNVVFVFVEILDVTTAKALAYARTVNADEVHAVHFEVDGAARDALLGLWSQPGVVRPPLEVVDARSRPVRDAAADLISGVVARRDTEATVLIPRHQRNRLIQRLLHSRTAGGVAASLSSMDRCNVAFLPYQSATTLVVDPNPLTRSVDEIGVR